MLNPECYLFAGPTLYREGGPLAVPPEIRVLPPVQRGDVERLRKAEPPGVIVLVDGLFHQNLAVAHIEIREAIAAGWRVWGLSSMGAIRACEMQSLGMRGWGDVFQLFVDEEFEDFQDDEVTLLHEPAPSYRPMTEPLVHLRVATDALVRAGHLTPGGRCAVIEQLKSLWYGERTLSRFGELLRTVPAPTPFSGEGETGRVEFYSHPPAPSLASERGGAYLQRSSKPKSRELNDPGATGVASCVVAGLLHGFDRFRIKTHDLERFLHAGVWREAIK